MDHRQLLQRYLSNNCTAAETEALFQWLTTAEGRRHLAATMGSDFEDTLRKAAPLPLPVRHRLEHRILRSVRPQRKVHFLRRYRTVAAAVLLLMGAAGYFLIPGQKDEAPAASIIAPGREGAVLTLSDGTQIRLDTIKNGVVALQGGVTAKVANGALVYEGRSTGIAYNTMSTPRGSQFRLTLPDGSNVWLNAGSSIRYPTHFGGRERKVSITGEVYFEIAGNSSMPFLVETRQAAIEVLGTQFNVNAYDNEQFISTTLLEGSIRVGTIVLQPGEQSLMNEKTHTVRKAETEKVMAWKNGLFNFDGLDIEAVMRQLERWYDIDVVYENGIPDITFGGELTKGISLNDLLVVLEKSDVHFRLEKGRKLIVTH